MPLCSCSTLVSPSRSCSVFPHLFLSPRTGNGGGYLTVFLLFPGMLVPKNGTSTLYRPQPMGNYRAASQFSLHPHPSILVYHQEGQDHFLFPWSPSTPGTVQATPQGLPMFWGTPAPVVNRQLVPHFLVLLLIPRQQVGSYPTPVPVAAPHPLLQGLLTGSSTTCPCDAS